MPNLKQYLRAQSVECAAAVTEVQKDASDTMDNYANQFADLVLILNSDNQEYFDEQFSNLNISVGEQYNLLQEQENGLLKDYSLVRTSVKDFKIVVHDFDGTIREAPIVVNGQLQSFKEDAELYYQNTTSGITFNFKTYMANLKDGIVQSDIIAKLCDCYRSLPNRLGLLKQLSQSYYDNGSAEIRSFLDELHVGVAQMAGTPKGFVNYLKGILESVRNKFRTQSHGLGLNDTDYSVQPYAWSGVVQLLGTVAETVMLAVKTAIGAVIGVIIKVLAMIFDAFRDAWQSLEPNWKVNADTDNYLESVPVYQQTFSEYDFHFEFIDKLFSMDDETSEPADSRYVDIYNDIYSNFYNKNMFTIDFLWFHFICWPVDEAGTITWCVECYFNLFGMVQPIRNTSVGPGYQYYWGYNSSRPGDLTTHIGIWPWSNYKSNFLSFVNSKNDTITAPNSEQVNQSASSLAAEAVTNCLYMSAVFARFDYLDTQQVTKNTIESGADDYDASPDNPDFTDFLFKIIYVLYENGMDPESNINVVIYQVLRRHPILFIDMFKSITSYFSYRANNDNDIDAILVRLFLVEGSQIISDHEFFAYPPKYGSAARSTLILASIATLAIGIGAAIGTTVAKVKIRGYMTKQYAKVQQAQTAMAEATTDDARNTAYKDFKKARKKYNLIASFTGQAKLSAVNGWEISDEPDSLDTYSMSNNPLINQTDTTDVEYQALSVGRVLKSIIG